LKVGSGVERGVVAAANSKVVRTVRDLHFSGDFRHARRQTDHACGWNCHREQEREYQALFYLSFFDMLLAWIWHAARMDLACYVAWQSSFAACVSRRSAI